MDSSIRGEAVKLFQQLRERRLVQIAVSYVAAGWALLQVVDQMADRGVVPDVVYQIVFIWYVVGIPAALLVGWYHGEKGKQRAPVSEIMMMALLMIFAVTFSGKAVAKQVIARRQAASAENPLEMRSIAVRYFDDQSQSGGYEYLADGLTEALISELQQVRGLDVVSRNGTLPFRGQDVPPDSIARTLQVGTVVEGSIAVKGDKVKVNLEVVDGQSGTPFQRKSFEEPLTDVATLREGVITETARLLREWIGEEVKVKERSAGTTNNGAWMQLQRAEKTWKDAEAKLAASDIRGAVSLLRTVDERLVEAEKADPKWVDPIVERAAVNYRMAYLAQDSAPLAVALIDTALGHAERALAMDRTNARALELRGTLNYFHWLLRVTPDAKEQAALKDRAQEDLEAAVRLDGTLASAYATLSHLYSQSSDADAVVAATRAYEEDAYLQNANVVLWRLFSGSLNLGNFTNARRWCNEGKRRFPADYRFAASCDLRLMTTPGTQPDVGSAWALLAKQDSVVPASRQAFEHVRGELMVGGVLARAGLRDSANAVIGRAERQLSPEFDPTQELLQITAYVRLLNGEQDRSVALLSRYAAAHPDAFVDSQGEVTWYWRDLEDNPRARKLFGLD